MKNMLIIKTLVVVGILGFLNANAQDTRYTQQFAAPLRINPAIMGANTDLRAVINYRNQWGNIAGGFTTYRFTFLYPVILNDDQGSLNTGLSVISDKAGAFDKLDIDLALSYSMPVSGSGHNISAALLVGYTQKSLDTEGLTFDEQYQLGSFDESNPNNEIVVNEKIGYPDLGGGILWYFNPASEGGGINAYAGVAVFHHNEPNESLISERDDLPLRIEIGRASCRERV